MKINMLSTIIKEGTKVAHQKVEAVIVRKIKAIQTEADYVTLLKGFYAYFKAVEANTNPFIDETVLPDKDNRRNSSYILNDIITLGGNIEQLPQAHPPKVTNTLEALSSLYVLEGSIMGGPYIVQLLQKNGITKGFSFFEGYGEASAAMWNGFTTVLNAHGVEETDHNQAVAVANDTFYQFGEVFN
ncbi:biliverdin-producing heme oxygenase [Sphingobacterium lactis]|uniref:biliverdin-producing heme oxygenase n=1 Tax=Sphingobacterium lactis TaxID=797291 RepID=UPI003DA2D696